MVTCDAPADHAIVDLSHDVSPLGDEVSVVPARVVYELPLLALVTPPHAASAVHAASAASQLACCVPPSLA